MYKYLNSYALSKKQFSEWLKQLAGKMKVVNIQLEHMYGPKDDNKKFIPYVIEQCINNVPGLKLTLGEQKRDFIFIQDVVSAYLCLLNKYKCLQDDYNEIEVGSGNSVTIRELVKTITKITSSRTRLLFGALPYRGNEIMESIADISMMKNLGWSPLVSLAEGIKKTILSYQER